MNMPPTTLVPAPRPHRLLQLRLCLLLHNELLQLRAGLLLGVGHGAGGFGFAKLGTGWQSSKAA